MTQQLFYLAWGFLVAGVVWTVVCLWTVVSITSWDPDSWHFRLIKQYYPENRWPPHMTCTYWLALFVAPYALVLIGIAALFLVLFVLVMEFLLSWCIGFLLFGKIPDTREELYDSSQQKYVTYWQTYPFSLQGDCVARDFSDRRVLPLPGILLFFIPLVIWLGWSQGTEQIIRGIQVGFSTALPGMLWTGVGGLCFIVLFFGYHLVKDQTHFKEKLKETWLLLRGKLCRPLPLKGETQ